MSSRGTLLVISGFSGAGKGTVIKSLINNYDNFALSVSATTRKPRDGEQDGISYFFKTKEEFQDMINKGELLEYATYVGNYYGTPKSYVEDKLKEGYNVILEIECVGAFNVRKMFPDALLMYIIPPTAEELERRLRGRGTEDEATINARLAKASKEAEGVEEYDYIIINDLVDNCVNDINGIISGSADTVEKCLTANNINRVNQIKKELEKFSKGE